MESVTQNTVAEESKTLMIVFCSSQSWQQDGTDHRADYIIRVRVDGSRC